MNIRSKVFGNAAIYLGANILNAGIPFLLLPILTRVLTPADYGIVAMFGIVLSVFGAFTGLSVHGAIGVRYFQMEKLELAEYVGSCVGILVMSTSIIFLLVALFGDRLEGVTGVPTHWLLLAVVLSGFQFLGNIQLSLWQVSGQAIQYGFFQVSQSLLNAGGSLFFILLIGFSWQGRILGQMSAIGLFGIIALWWLLKNGSLRLSKNWGKHGRDALNFGVPLIPHVIGSLIVTTAGQFFVTNMFGVSETGLYVVGAQFGMIVGILADAFVKTYGPWLYEKLKDDSIANRHLIVGTTYCIFILFLLLSLISCFIIFLIFPFVVGEKFSDAQFLAYFFIFGNGIVGMYYAIAGFFFFTSKTKFVSIVTISSGVVSIFAMWILGGLLGVEGVALGYLLSQIFMLLLAWGMSSFVYPLPWGQVRSAFSMAFSLYLKK